MFTVVHDQTSLLQWRVQKSQSVETFVKDLALVNPYYILCKDPLLNLKGEVNE